MSFLVAWLFSIENIFGLCPSFNLKAFQWQQLDEIWPYMGSSIIAPFVYNPIYSLSNWSCSKVHLNSDVRIYGSSGPPVVSMKSISSSQCLTSVYEAWIWFGDRMISLPFDTWQITTMNVVFANSGRLHLAILLKRSPKSVAVRLLPRLPLLLAPRISLADFFKNISTHCQRIHFAVSKLSDDSQLSNVSKQSATAVSQWRGPFLSCFQWFCPWILDRCLVSRNPATHTFFHLLSTL